MILRDPVDAILCRLWTRGLYRVGGDVPWGKIIAVHVYARRMLPTPYPEMAAAALLARCTELGAKFSEGDRDELMVLLADILRQVEPLAAPPLAPADAAPIPAFIET